MTLKEKLIAKIESHPTPESIASFADAYKTFAVMLSFNDFREMANGAGYNVPCYKTMKRHE